jgi:3-deoxy-manno-octulosonate cytidylyltransferase (CMP-KDO synthetase)
VSTTVAIPARLASSRLPRKVLADIGGRTMLDHVHQVAVRADCGSVVVLTDAPEVAQEVAGFGGQVLMTDPGHESGTARIAAALDDLDGDVIVNLQGDAPLLDPSVVAESAEQAARSGAPVTLPVYPLRGAEVLDPAVVKVVRTHAGRVMYCSRSVVPYVRNDPDNWETRANFWGHAGLYAYTREFLRNFQDLPTSPLEQAERLEQLRWLQAGLYVHSFEVPEQGPSVDTPADLERARDLLLARAVR